MDGRPLNRVPGERGGGRHNSRKVACLPAIAMSGGSARATPATPGFTEARSRATMYSFSCPSNLRTSAKLQEVTAITLSIRPLMSHPSERQSLRAGAPPPAKTIPASLDKRPTIPLLYWNWRDTLTTRERSPLESGPGRKNKSRAARLGLI